jgi:hypothetical protein
VLDRLTNELAKEHMQKEEDEDRVLRIEQLKTLLQQDKERLETEEHKRKKKEEELARK